MKLFALSDLHINHPANRAAVAMLPAHPDDWLILAGDCSDTVDDLAWLLQELRPKWRNLIWVPGNHELWTRPDDPCQKFGVERYLHLIELCRSLDVHTPEDPYPQWPGDASSFLVPMFLLYDYSYGPKGLSRDEIINWSAEAGIRCADERFLHTTPHASPVEWCQERIAFTQRRLENLPKGSSTVLINHFPMRADLVRLPMIPRFVPWCGTRQTEDWHVRYNAKVVVTGHLHMRATDWRDGVRFEEVSIGYPRHWRPEEPMENYLREVLPETDQTQIRGDSTIWRF